MRTVGAILLVAAAIALPIGSAQSQQRMYKLTDENGRVYYSDKIPTEHANRDRTVLNDQGVHVGFEEGEITEAERAENAEREAAAEAERRAKADVARNDRMLLETYLSVADIEALRDRRLELLESHIKLTDVFLGNLRKKLIQLQSEASSYKPYTTQPDAPQIPESLAREISQTTRSIADYEQKLASTRSDQERLRASFERDIARFRELKGG